MSITFRMSVYYVFQLKIQNVFPPGDLRFVSDTKTNFVVMYNFNLDV